MELNFNENVDTLFAKLEDFFRSHTVIGEPIQVGDTTLIPIIDVSIGVGLGGGDGVDEKGNKGNGGGGGVGAKGSPTAVIAIQRDRIEMMPIRKQAGLEKLVEMVPDILARINLDRGDEPARQSGKDQKEQEG